LYHIDLRNNAFSTMQTSTLKAFDVIVKKSRSENHLAVDLRENQWVCDCNLKDFTKWLKTTDVTVKFTKTMTCHDGKYLGKTLQAIEESDLVCAVPEKPTNAGVAVVSVLFAVVSVLFAIVGCAVLVVLFLKRDSLKTCFKVRIAEPFRRRYFAKSGNYSYSSAGEKVDVNV